MRFTASRAFMNTALEPAIKSGAFPNRNPFQQVQRPRHRPQEKSALTRDEVERLLKAAQEIDDRFAGVGGSVAFVTGEELCSSLRQSRISVGPSTS